MWHKDFADRLRSWANLRLDTADLAPQQAYQNINDWWLASPWRPYYLHWDDRVAWPDPWQLLADNIYCDLARALGIVYTIGMCRPQDIDQIQICDTDQGNLVMIHQGKYILNWAPGEILNKPSHTFRTKRTLPGALLLPRDTA